VRDRDGRVVAALSVTCPTSRLPRERIPVVAADAQQAADAISRRLGWR
jgi:DNA-binding IclR family transcriptional regulator